MEQHFKGAERSTARLVQQLEIAQESGLFADPIPLGLSETLNNTEKLEIVASIETIAFRFTTSGRFGVRWPLHFSW